MANVSQLQPALTHPQIQASSREAQDKDADFLALRLLNKRARLRLSPALLDLASFPSKPSLFAIVNSKGWFVAVVRDASGTSALILSPLANLRSALAAASSEDEQPFRPQRRIPINGATPHILTLACNDTRILLGMMDGSIQVYTSDQLFSSGENIVRPIHVFATSSSAALLSIQPNPGDIPELVAVLRDCESSPSSLAVELLDMQNLISSGGWIAGESPSTTPTSISWSPKGKQLALGLQSGDIVTFSPTATATPKFSIPHPPSAGNMSVISIHWLSTSSFHTIYAPPGRLTPDVDQIHFHVSFDSKSNSSQDIRFSNPYLPFPGLRPPGEHLVCLRGWDPSKALLFIGDSTSSDIGLIGNVATNSGESWHNLSLEETSTPSLPLDKDQNDTILLGMDVDLTNMESYHHSTASGEAIELPAPPIMYVYASDGTILGWHVLNLSGKSYPGMVTLSDTSISVPSMLSVPSGMVRELSSDMQTTPTVSPTISAPTEAPEVKPPSTVFGQPSGFGTRSSGFGTSGSAFGQPPVFDQMQSGFVQQSTSAFGQPSLFMQPATTTSGLIAAPSGFGQSSTPTYGSAVSSGGFGAFSSTGPAKFGQTAFGFGGSTQPTTPTVPLSTSVPEESMASDDAPSFGGLGLGGPGSEDSDSKPSIFGKVSAPVSSSQPSTGGSFIKPGTGFGAFASFDQKSAFAKVSAFSNAQPSTTTFGANSFQTKAESAPSISSFGASPAFGQPTFGQTAPTSTFGQPAFGQSSFSQLQTGGSAFGKLSFGVVSSSPVPAMIPSTDTSTGGAFSAFASGTQSAFGVAASKNGPSAKPVWATGDSSKPPEPNPSGATIVPNAPTESPESKTPPKIQPKTISAFSAPSQIAARDSFVRDDGSRSPSPVTPQQQEGTPSAFTSSAPGPSTGAFGSLQTTPSAFVKPASGFFGQLPKDSPFFAPNPTESKPISAFALSATSGTPTSTPPKPSSTQPTFGSSSMFAGTLKSAFPPASTTPTQPSPVTINGAFNAFAGAAGGFAAFSSGGNKSFTDILRTTSEDKPPETKPSEAKPAPGPGTPQPPISTTPTKEPPHSPTMPTTAPEPQKEEAEIVEAKSKVPLEPEEKPKEAIPVQPSLESISSSTSSSFVEVERDEEEEEDEDEGESEAEDDRDDDEWLPSDEPSESESSEEESERLSRLLDRKDGGKAHKEIEPAEIPLPVTPTSTRSPSTTPKAEHPNIPIPILSPPQVPPPPVPRVSPVRDLGMTPPSSPKDAPSVVQIPVSAPKPCPPPTTPFSLAPRSNNRPLRSSPLASTPIVVEGEAEKTPPVSRSAPPVAQPATPKVPFGQWTPLPVPPPSLTSTSPTSGEKPALAGFAPITMPTPTSSVSPSQADSLLKTSIPPPFPPPAEKPSLPAFTPTTMPTSTLSLFAPADKVAIPTTVPTIAPVPTMALFGPSAGLSLFLVSGTPSSWGTPSKSAEGTPPSTKPAQTLFGGQPSLFGPKAGQAVPISASPSPFSPLVSPSLGPTPPLTRSPVLPSTPSPTPEQGMQAECLYLVATLDKGLESLKQLAMVVSMTTDELKKTSGIVHQQADLGDPHKWTFGDIEEYGKVLSNVESDVRELKLQRVSLRKALKELDSNLLKVNTRKEEIARFNKAKTDADFAKMLKIRTLAPEYSETQSRLRKNIRTIRDRVQKLEDHLQASKKRINELRTGRPSIRPPTLDTVNRTLRNIDTAIDQQKQDVSQLRRRMAQLENSGGPGARDQLAVSFSKRPLNVTPNVAVTTAAALNAERSAQRLKKALLASRTRPLLNTTATASLVPTSFQTPQKPTVAKSDARTPDVKSPGSGFGLPNPPGMSFPSSLSGWTPPPSSEFSPLHDISPSRNRGGIKHHHQKPIVLNKKAVSPGPSPVPTQPSAFDWKLPVEPIRPVSSLPFALRPAGSS